MQRAAHAGGDWLHAPSRCARCRITGGSSSSPPAAQVAVDENGPQPWRCGATRDEGERSRGGRYRPGDRAVADD